MELLAVSETSEYIILLNHFRKAERKLRNASCLRSAFPKWFSAIRGTTTTYSDMTAFVHDNIRIRQHNSIRNKMIFEQDFIWTRRHLNMTISRVFIRTRRFRLRMLLSVDGAASQGRRDEGHRGASASRAKPSHQAIQRRI